MSSVAAALPHQQPGDEDLAALYNQVLAGFAEESPTSDAPMQAIPSALENENQRPYSDGRDAASFRTLSNHIPPAGPVAKGRLIFIDYRYC